MKSAVTIVQSLASDAHSAAVLAQTLTLGASDMSDIRSAINAITVNVSASDMSDIASRVDVLLASRLSDILSAAQQTNSRALTIQSQTSDIYSLLSDVSSDIGVMSGVQSDIYSLLSDVASDIIVMSGIQSDIMSAATAIKTKTDQLTFGAANAVNANTTHVKQIVIGGTGTSGDPWGPA